MLLDETRALREIDRTNVLSAMEKTPIRLAAPADAKSTCRGRFGGFENVVFGGLGGSGIVGEIVSDYCRESTNIPVSICRTLRIPRFVGKKTLFVAISYSGETQETLHQSSQATRQGARVIVITSGGQLLSKSKRSGIPYLRVAPGLLPRLALPELLGASVFAMGTAGLLARTTKLLTEAADSLTDSIEKIRQTVPLARNSAKQMAQALVDRLPLLIGDEAYGSVMRRFKNELNENAKIPALSYSLPEGYHDDIEGLDALTKLCNPQPILLRTENETEGQKRTREQLLQVLGDLGFPPILEFKGEGRGKLSRLLTAIMFADYVSVYLAALRRVDPAELTLIPEFRKAMSGK